MVSRVKTYDIDLVYPKVIKLIEKALEYNDEGFSVQSVYRDLKKGKYQLWVVFNKEYKAICITGLLRNDVLRIILLGGSDFDSWKDELDSILADWGRDKGAKFIDLVGRKGWLRKLKKLNYKPKLYILEKAI